MRANRRHEWRGRQRVSGSLSKCRRSGAFWNPMSRCIFVSSWQEIKKKKRRLTGKKTRKQQEGGPHCCSASRTDARHTAILVYQVCMCIYYCCLQYSCEVSGRCEELVWRQRRRLIGSRFMFTSFLLGPFKKLSAQPSADSLFWRQHQTTNAFRFFFSSPISTDRNYEHLCCEETSYFIAVRPETLAQCRTFKHRMWGDEKKIKKKEAETESSVMSRAQSLQHNVEVKKKTKKTAGSSLHSVL